MRKTLLTAALVLALSCPALAGVIHTPPVTQPPPPSMTAEEQETDGEIQNGAADSLTETLLSALGSVLALL
jgi:hypothetical protein